MSGASRPSTNLVRLKIFRHQMTLSPSSLPVVHSSLSFGSMIKQPRLLSESFVPHQSSKMVSHDLGSMSTLRSPAAKAKVSGDLLLLHGDSTTWWIWRPPRTRGFGLAVTSNLHPLSSTPMFQLERLSSSVCMDHSLSQSTQASSLPPSICLMSAVQRSTRGTSHGRSRRMYCYYHLRLSLQHHCRFSIGSRSLHHCCLRVTHANSGYRVLSHRRIWFVIEFQYVYIA